MILGAAYIQLEVNLNALDAVAEQAGEIMEKIERTLEDKPEPLEWQR